MEPQLVLSRAVRSVHWLAAILLLLAVPSAHAGWQTFRYEDGLVGNGVTAMVRDTSGALWFGVSGTPAGVTRYDGAGWQSFTTADGLADRLVFTMCADPAGRLWVGGRLGASRWDGQSWTTLRTDAGLNPTNYINSIVVDAQGRPWFCGGGVFRLESDQLVPVPNPEVHFPSGPMRFDRNGGLWVVLQGLAVGRFDGQTWSVHEPVDRFGGYPPTAIAEDAAGAMWFGCGAGAYRFDGTSWRKFTTADGMVGDEVLSILVDAAGHVWIGSTAGLSRYDGVTWRTYTSADGLVHNRVESLLEDDAGNVWAGTPAGASRFDRSSWRHYGSGDGLTGTDVEAVHEDANGDLWYATSGGVSRYDGRTWSSYTTADGLGPGKVLSILRDRHGFLWVGTQLAVSRFDGATWTTWTTAAGRDFRFVRSIAQDPSGAICFASLSGLYRYDGVNWGLSTGAEFGLPTSDTRALAVDRSGTLWIGTTRGVTRYDGTAFTPLESFTAAVSSVLEDNAGDLWFGTAGGAVRYDHVSFMTFGVNHGLGSVSDAHEDGAGDLWFATGDGAVRFDGLRWHSYTVKAGANTLCVLEDRMGRMWFGHTSGVSRHEPDLIPPRTLLLEKPPAVSPSPAHRFTFAAAYGEVQGVEFSHSQDGAPWSLWSSSREWAPLPLGDGPHSFEVRARDGLGNEDPTPAAWAFEVDATPPAPVVASPAYGEAVRGTVSVLGAAADPRFREYRVEVRGEGEPSWATLTASGLPVGNGMLASWDTSGIPDGPYELRVSVSDMLGLTGVALVNVVVDNVAPPADQTSPARILAREGGHVYTTHADVHLYLPPHGLSEDADVIIAPIPPVDVPETLPDGAVRALPGYELSFGAAVLQKPITLELAYAGTTLPPGTPGLYHQAGTGQWQRVGGSRVGEGQRIAAAVTSAGRYALFTEVGTAPGGVSALSALSLTPRVFSPGGSFGDRRVAIGFDLEREAPVTVTVFNRAGHLVREVVRGQTFGPGANLVWWDGKDGQGAVVLDGMYIVSLSGPGQRLARPVVVVR